VEAAQTVPSNLSGWTPKASLSTGSIVLNLKGAGPILEKPGSAYFFPQDVGVVSLSKPETFTLCQTGLVAHLPVSEYAQHAPTRLRGVLVAPPGMDWMGHGHAIAIDVPISSS
jgi:hypothetical protein